MAQVIVRNLDDAVKRKLQRRAARHGHSMEAEIRDILRGMGLDFGMQFDEQGNPIPGTGEGAIEDEATGGDEDELDTAVQ